MKKITLIMVSMLLTLFSFMQVKANCPGVGINVAPASTPTSQICTGTSLTITGTYTGDAPYTMQLLNGTTALFTATGVTVTSVSFVLPSGSSGTYKITILPHGSCTGQKFSTPNTPYVDLSLNAYYLNFFGTNCYIPGGYDLGLQGDDGSGIIYSLYRSSNLITTLTGTTDIGPDFLPVDFGNQTTPGTYSIVGFNPSTGCTAPQGQTGNSSLTINPLPVKPTITGTNPLCVQSTNIFQISTVAGESYTWTISTTGAPFVSSYNKATITALGIGSALLTVTATNSCGSTVSDVKSVSIVDYRNILTISGALNFVEIGHTAAYLSNSVSGVTYNWSVTGGGTIASSSNLTTLTGTSGGIATLKVQGTGVCNTNIASYNVNVLYQPCTSGSTNSNTYAVGLNNTYVNTVTGNGYELGSVGTTTSISGSGLQLDGIYHLLGNVIVNGGNPTILGVKLYADPNVGITFSGANLTVNSSLLTSVCPTITTAGSNALSVQGVWLGVGAINSGQINLVNYSTISGASIGVFVDGSTNAKYYIDKATFFNNSYGFNEVNRGSLTSGLVIQNSTFSGSGLAFAAGIYVVNSPSSYVLVQNNVITNSTNGGIYLTCKADVLNNRLSNNNKVGIYFFSTSINVTNNIISSGFIMGTSTGIAYGMFLGSSTTATGFNVSSNYINQTSSSSNIVSTGRLIGIYSTNPWGVQTFNLNTIIGMGEFGIDQEGGMLF